MKEKLIKVLHALGWDALLLGLLEKIALGLIKKLTAWTERLHSFLERAQTYRNEAFR